MSRNTRRDIQQKKHRRARSQRWFWRWVQYLLDPLPVSGETS